MEKLFCIKFLYTYTFIILFTLLLHKKTWVSTITKVTILTMYYNILTESVLENLDNIIFILFDDNLFKLSIKIMVFGSTWTIFKNILLKESIFQLSIISQS